MPDPIYSSPAEAAEMSHRRTVRKRDQRARKLAREEGELQLERYREMLRCLLHASGVHAGRSLYVVRNASLGSAIRARLMKMAPAGTEIDPQGDYTSLVLPNSHTISIAWNFEYRQGRALTASEIFVDPSARSAL